MSNVKRSLTELIGNTPLLELVNYEKKKHLCGRIIAKLEYFNPLGSVKDRVGYAMLEEAEKRGDITSNTLIIEPTSGNTGVGLAFTAAIKGYRLILTMPETMSVERRKLLAALGAEIVLTDGSKGMRGAIEKALEIAKENPDSFIPQQFENEDNPEVHRRTTAQEILRDTDGRVDFLVAGVGTGGTITGVGEVLKKQIPGCKVIAVEPKGSAVLSGCPAGPHGLQGIGAGFVPKILNTDLIDEIIPVETEEAFQASRTAARCEGLLVGISSGAALHAASVIAARPENKDKSIVVILPDTGERYLSTPLFD